MILSGLANDGEEKYFVNRRVNFSYVSQGSFYRFHYGEVNYSPRDTLPEEVYTYFFSNESTFYHIRSVDKNTLMFSNAYSPMFYVISNPDFYLVLYVSLRCISVTLYILDSCLLARN